MPVLNGGNDPQCLGIILQEPISRDTGSDEAGEPCRILHALHQDEAYRMQRLADEFARMPEEEGAAWREYGQRMDAILSRIFTERCPVFVRFPDVGGYRKALVMHELRLGASDFPAFLLQTHEEIPILSEK